MSYEVNEENILYFNESFISKKILKYYCHLSPHLLNSGNYFLQTGLKKIIHDGFAVKSPVNFTHIINNTPKQVHILLTFSDPKLAKPFYFKNNVKYDMLPSHAIKQRKTYGTSLTLTAVIDIILDNNAYKTFKFPGLYIGIIPIMCGSVLCNAKDIPRNQWDNLDIPDECIGMNILDGHMYSTITKKDMMIGKLYTSVISIKKEDSTIMYKYNLKGQILSSANPENIRSTQLEFHAETFRGDIPSLVCEWKIEYFDSIYLPFYVFFYLLGEISDYEIVGFIVKNYDTKKEKSLFDVLRRILSEPNPLHGHARESEMWKHLHEHLIVNQKTNVLSIHKVLPVNNLTLKAVKEIFNEKFLSQVGTTEKDIKSKKIFYGSLVREMLLKYIALRNVDHESKAHLIGESDRVEMTNATLTLPHDTQRKMFTTSFHKRFVSDMRKNIENITQTVTDMEVLSNVDFASIFSKYKSTENKSAEEFSHDMRAITPPITRPDANKKERPNFQSSDASKGRYNILEKQSSFIAFPKYTNISKSSIINSLQKPPPSGFGVVFGNMSTPESEPGKRQGVSMTVTFTIPAPVESVKLIKEKLYNHPLIITLRNVSSIDRQLSVYYYVYFNNAMFGITHNPLQVKKDFIEMRRNNNIYRDTSVFIDVNTNSIRLNTISGRGKSFLFIVYSNIDDIISKKTDKFKQWINYDLVKDKDKTLNELINEKKIEATFSDDCTDQHVAPDQLDFKRYENDITVQFTHLDIMSNFLAITTANIPFVGNIPGNRATFGGCHQLGAADIAFPQLSGKKKNMSLKSLNFSLISRLPQEVAFPNISLPIVAMAPHISAQEDGLTIRKSPVAMGYMSGNYYDKKISTLTSGYNLHKPSPFNTSNVHADWNYDKLDANGVVSVGSYVKENDVLIGMTRSNVDTDTGKSYVDVSQIYRGPNEASVIMVQCDKKIKEGGNISALLYKDMPLRIGDKTATITANKAVISSIVSECELFSSSNGLSPTVLINPEAIINRDLYNTLFIILLSLLALHDGKFYDGFGFQNPLDIIESSAAKDKFKTMTGTEEGLTLVYDNTTGDPIDYYLMGPLDQLRIQKNGETEMYAVGDAKINKKTKQPDSGGRNSGGSHRISEMDIQAFNGHGLTIIPEEFQTDRIEEVYCLRCNREAICNVEEKTYFCTKCGNNDQVYCSDSTFAIADTRSRMLVGGNIGFFPILQPPLEIKGVINNKKNITYFN